MEIFKEIIAKGNWGTAEELLKLVREQGRVLVAALPQESVTANVARRILKLIREEFDNVQHRVSPLITSFLNPIISSLFFPLAVQTTDHRREPGLVVTAQTGHADQ